MRAICPRVGREYAARVITDVGRRRLLRAVLRTAALYGFAGWAYIALNAVNHPETLELPLTHVVDWPREDTFGIASFAVSALSFFLLQLLRDDP